MCGKRRGEPQRNIMKAFKKIAGRLRRRMRPATVAKAREQAFALVAGGDYAQARLAFERYLTSQPGDFDAWIKLGECCIELQDLAQAETCFDTAIAAQPDNALGYVHLARMLQADERPLGALLRYRKALALAPAFPFTPAEADMLQQDARDSAADTTANRAGIVLDVSDLLKYLRVNVGMTGIQRVQMSVISSILKSFAARDIRFGFCGKTAGQIFTIAEGRIFDLIDEVNHPAVSRDNLDLRLRAVRADATPTKFHNGDVFMLLGAFWIFRTYAQTISILRRQGVKVGVYVYDLIPLTHPHYFAIPLRLSYRAQFAKVMKVVDFACTISEFVAGDLRMALANNLQRSIPVAAVPLAQDMPKQATPVDEAFREQTPHEFVLCVCTLEVRKNHLLLLDIWSNLYRKYGNEIPSLILVGKWGWKIKPFRNRLQKSKNVDGKIIVLGSLSEARLAHLYQNCLFTIFPSFVEGWGLPVGESLSFGRPCIASNTSAIPEVGGDLVRYIDPYDAEAAQVIIEQTLADRDGLAAWAARVEREFKPRSWREVTENLLLRIDDCAVSAAMRKEPSVVGESVTYDVSTSGAR
jgi:glycosyltransferase involved in cell wall biosynthesis